MLKRVNSQLETITEKHPAEEDAIAMSMGQAQLGASSKFDIEASHSFSLRTYGKDKASAQFIDGMRADMIGEENRDSAMSNYSKIQADTQHRRS